MNTGTRRALTGSIHKIREFELEKVSLVEEFDILQIVGEGWFGKILLVEHRASDTEIVLKALPKPYVSIRDFYREFHYGLHLSAHKNIVTTFDVAFETAGFYVFCQEYAPLGDLTSNMLDTGIGEIHTKRVAKQLAAALEHLHQRELVHRDVKLDNILIFKSDFSRIKLCDFGETRKVNSVVRRRNEWLPYSPPEVLKLSMDSSYKALITHDVWQYGIVIFICLTGCLPWQKAAFDDPRYTSFFNWYSSANPLKKQPKLWKMVSSRAQKMFKKFVEPRIEKRVKNFQEIFRYYDDRWMAKGFTDRVAGEDIDELCPSMYSFHSDPNEKNILLKHFRDNGIETTVDRQAKKQRIRDWIQNSVIEEADEEEESLHESFFDESDGELEDRSRNHPLDESHRVTLRFDTDKHINPRTGEVIEGVKPPPVDKNPLSYDVQNIEPVAPANVVRRYGVKEEGSSQSSTKDSAYGSMDVKVSSTSNTMHAPQVNHIPSVESSHRNSPSRSLSSTSNKYSKSPLSVHAQRIKTTEEVFTQEMDNMKGSSSTLHSLGNSTRSNSLQIVRTDSMDGFISNNAYNPASVQYPTMSSSAKPNYAVPVQNSTANSLVKPNYTVSAQNQTTNTSTLPNYPIPTQNPTINPSTQPNYSVPTLNATKYPTIVPNNQVSSQLPSSNSSTTPNYPLTGLNPGTNTSSQPEFSVSIQSTNPNNSSQQNYPVLNQNTNPSTSTVPQHPISNPNHTANLSTIPNNPTITQNGFSPGGGYFQPKYVSMKDTAYDSIRTEPVVPQNNIYNNQVPESPYTSMMNIVQGQIKISPHANEVNKNIVNVSVTPVNRR